MAPHEARSGQRSDAAAEGGIRRSAWLLLAGVAAVVFVFLSPYVTLFPFVGSFPAEDVRESLPGSYFAEALCLPERSGPDAPQERPPSPPALRVEQGLAPIPKGLFERSSSLYFSERTGEIVALDAIAEEDANKLWMLETQRSVPRARLESFLEDSDWYYDGCKVPRIDRGITEGYWATKGASVLHHWVHLYEGSLGGSVHGQYGYAIPWGVRKVLEWSSSVGPTDFVRLSWVVFAACGLAYLAVFLLVFRDHPRLALLALGLKLLFFSRIGGFALLLAPGFHWYRELVLVAVGALLQWAASSWSAMGPRRGWWRLVAMGAALLVCFLVEPTFFLVAVSCAVLAVLWGHQRAVVDYIKAKADGRYLLVLLAILATAVIAVVALQGSKLAYVSQKLRGDDLVLPAAKYVTRTLVTCAASFGFLVVLRGRPQLVVHGYFALVALVASLYYFVTPDSFHFYKFAEYAVPFGVALAGFVVDRHGGWARSHFALPRRWLTGATATGLVALAMIASGNLRKTPVQWERRLRDSFGVPYFQAAPFTINGRMIRANISERLAEHLRAFPAAAQVDFMVSPFDKYVTFLYDRTNGFSAPDLVAWLDSSGKLERSLRSTAGSDRPVLVLLDEATLDVDPRFGVREGHSVLGSLHLASKLNLKGRLRAADLGAELMARCAVDERGGSKRWRLLRCGGPNRGG
jgi:hypothetical protein